MLGTVSTGGARQVTHDRAMHMPGHDPSYLPVPIKHFAEGPPAPVGQPNRVPCGDARPQRRVVHRDQRRLLW